MVDTACWIDTYLPHHGVLAGAVVYDPAEAGTIGHPGNSTIHLLIETGNKADAIGPNSLRGRFVAIEALVNGGLTGFDPIPPAVGDNDISVPAERVELTIDGQVFWIVALPVGVNSWGLPDVRECDDNNEQDDAFQLNELLLIVIRRASLE